MSETISDERITPTDEQFSDPYLRKLTEVWHANKCWQNHIDQCAFGIGGWEGTHETRWGTMRNWMGRLLRAIGHAEKCGLTLEQFIAYERLAPKEH